jgi:hypothetical protein
MNTLKLIVVHKFCHFFKVGQWAGLNFFEKARPRDLVLGHESLLIGFHAEELGSASQLDQ